jgi:hypothetical protein
VSRLLSPDCAKAVGAPTTMYAENTLSKQHYFAADLGVAAPSGYQVADTNGYTVTLDGNIFSILSTHPSNGPTARPVQLACYRDSPKCLDLTQLSSTPLTSRRHTSYTSSATHSDGAMIHLSQANDLRIVTTISTPRVSWITVLRTRSR